jgi:SAM-dependent methyltransferase
MAHFLRARGLPTPELERVQSLAGILAACRATYGTSGLASLRAIPDRSLDFIWSHTVLQHVRREEFLETMCQLRRVLRLDGVCSHLVNLRDHLGGALNHLRFSERVWESRLMAKSGFYTNRIRYAEMLALFKEAGFKADVVKVKRWETLPTPRPKLARQFQHLSEDDLCVSGFAVVLRAA